MPLISIITINYNNKVGLSNTLDSVRSQSFSDYEHIIVDGGSSDGSKEVIQESLKDSDYSRHVSWWCSEKDSGIYNAMNKGLHKASGQFVYILNSGDSLLPDALEKVSVYLRENQDSVVYGPVDTYLDGKFKQTTGIGADHLPEGMIPHQGVFVPLKFHSQYGNYDEKLKICADREFMLRLYNNKVPFIHMPVVVSNYDLGGLSETKAWTFLKETYKLDKTVGRKKNRFIRMLKGLAKKWLSL